MSDLIRRLGATSARAMELPEERFPAAMGGSAMAVFAIPDGAPLSEHDDAIAAVLDEVAQVEHVVAVAAAHGRESIQASNGIGVSS